MRLRTPSHIRPSDAVFLILVAGIVAALLRSGPL